MQVDVLIVGAGPTGLMLANQLARHGVKPLIIDRHSGPAQQSRAMAVQARTLEIYSKMGLIDAALDLGKVGSAANMWANGRLTARIPLGDIGKDLSPYPFVLMLGQDDNEKIMGEKLNALGTEVLWNTELVALNQKATHVEATIKKPDGTTEFWTTAWVAGCDGARSAVRELNGITFPGAPYEHVFFVADTTAKGAMKQDELNVYLWRDGFHLFFPMRGQDRWRVIGILPKQLRSMTDDVTFDDVVPELRKEAGRDLSFQACHWFSTYRIHHRAASQFRDRRCFILGDAAHVHSPMGAQGMNTGLQDAYNLAWKLALVVQGRASPELLDSYEQERIPVAQQLLRTTDRAFQLVVSEGWLAGVFRTRIMARVAAFAMTIERIRKTAFRTISQIGISYPQSSLSKAQTLMPNGAPAPGDRFPWIQLSDARSPGRDVLQELDDTRFNLVVFGQLVITRTSRELSGILNVISISEDDLRDGARIIPSPSFYLLRPDGHVGLCGTFLNTREVTEYLTKHVHLLVGAAVH
jgi:2-polyprenyl-6-methoxyphenol hydroxylase-like FAD-dependent oxidoreductase